MNGIIYTFFHCRFVYLVKKIHFSHIFASYFASSSFLLGLGHGGPDGIQPYSESLFQISA